MTRHAFIHRTLYGGGLVLAALGAVQVAHAGYASVQPPTAVQGGPGAYQIKKTADIAIQKAAASANAYMKGVGRIPGVSAPIPFMSRVAATAPAAAARFIFLNPGVALGVTAVSFLASEYMTYEDGSWFYADPNNPGATPSTGSLYRITITTAPTYLYGSSAQDVCNKARDYYNPAYIAAVVSWGASCEVRYTNNIIYKTHGINNQSCPTGWYITPAGCVQSLPPSKIEQTIDDFVQKVAPKIAPEKIPEYFPMYPIPVEDPIISPDISTDEDAATPKPYYVPIGDPQLIPGTDPAQWSQPMIRVNPSPTAADPWRVDLQPVNRVSDEAAPVTQPTQNPTSPTASGTSPTTEAEADPDLCVKNPDILACQKPELDEPEVELPKDTINISYTAESLGGGGSCIAPVDINYFGHSARILDTNQACGWISSYLRPVALLVAAFISLGIVVGGLKTE